MSQLRFSAIILSYIFIIWYTFNTGNIPISILSVLLAINYIKTKFYLADFNKIIKNELQTQRENFINSLSHDIRIPTIAQIRALELLKNQKLGNLNDSQKEMVMQIENSCKCILNLMSLMINTYNMENNKYSLIYEKFNISEVIYSCFDELINEAAEKQIKFEYDNNIETPSIIADKTELKKVIMNILSTSITNANAGEIISVSTISFNDKVRLSFKSNNNFYLSNICEHTNYTSVGQKIRMGFCKKIIENHHGKIIKNNNQNLFSFELPIFALE